MLTIQADSFPGAAEIMSALRHIKKKYGLTCTLLGAGARNILLADVYHGTPAATKDADFALMALSMTNYQEIQEHFIQECDFSAHSTKRLTLISPSGYELDLLPFGPLEENHEIPLPSFERAAQVHGLEEAVVHAIPCTFEGEEFVQVVSLAGLVMLKLISFNDRPEERLKDVEDIAFILLNSFDHLEDDIYDDKQQHFHLLTEYDPANIHYSSQIVCRVLGRKVQVICDESPNLTQRIHQILENHLNEGRDGDLVQVLIRQSRSSLYPTMADEEGNYLLEQFRLGFIE